MRTSGSDVTCSCDVFSASVYKLKPDVKRKSRNEATCRIVFLMRRSRERQGKEAGTRRVRKVSLFSPKIPNAFWLEYEGKVWDSESAWEKRQRASSVPPGDDSLSRSADWELKNVNDMKPVHTWLRLGGRGSAYFEEENSQLSFFFF